MGAGVMLGCSPAATTTVDPIRKVSSRLATENGLAENGLAENGLAENGLAENGLAENGLAENGLAENGLAENGLAENGLAENGLSTLDIMKDDPNAIALVQYMYSCAMPPDAHMTLAAFTHRAVDGSIVTEDVQFDGALGLAPEWGSDPSSPYCATTILGPCGQCNEECQKWVSACILSRTNAYGVHVEISVRAPRGHFDASSKDGQQALERTKYLKLSSTDGGTDTVDGGVDESALYPLREGSYFGNIFASAFDASKGFDVHRPKYYACAGPFSSIPQLTNRFCSGQGDDCVIYTGDANSHTVNPQPALNGWETCTDSPPFNACDALDAEGGAAFGCTGADGNKYDEVLTIYLKQPVPTCGNHVCEGPDPAKVYPPGTQFETDVSCPSDCHPGTFAKGVDLLQPQAGEDGGPACPDGQCFTSSQSGDQPDFGRRFALAPDGTMVRVLDMLPHSGPGINFGDELEDTLSAPGNASILTRFTPAGSALTAHLLTLNVSGEQVLPTHARAVTTDSAGNIYVVTTDPLKVTKFDPNGDDVSPPWVATDFAGPGAAPPPNVVAGPVAADAAGNIFLLWSSRFINAAGADLLFPAVTEFDPAGRFLRLITLFPNGTDNTIDVSQGSIAIDSAGNVYACDLRNVHKIPADGTPPSFPPMVVAQNFGGFIRLTGIAVDADRSLYVSGWSNDSILPPLASDTGRGRGAFVMKFNADGVFQNSDVNPAVQWPYVVPTNIGEVTPIDVRIDRDGNVIAVGGFQGNGITPQFGPLALTGDSGVGPDAGEVSLPPFDTQGSADTFVTALSKDGSFIWAKPLQFFSNGGTDNVLLGQDGTVFLTGGFNGSMTLDERQLIHPHPALLEDQAFFIGGFRSPCTTPGCDPTPPKFTLEFVPGSPVSTVNSPIRVYATSGQGAVVHYNQPTATNAPGDTNYDGISVTCLPLSGSTFPIGTTVVHCTASDPHGNTTRTEFPITVVDMGPVFFDVPPGGTFGATSPAGAIVTYNPPTARDPFSGMAVPVTCQPQSGATFPVGITLVDCSATSASGATNHVKIKFVVEPPHNPPIITVPKPGIVVDATSGTGAVVTYAASAKDALGHMIPVTCVPASGSHFPLGTTTVTCSAVDASGNSATATFTVQVRFHWFGLLPPIKNDGTSSFKLGSAIPVKFRLSDGITNAVANLTLAKVTKGVAGPEQPAVSVGNANQGNLFRFDAKGCIYIYDLATNRLSKGVWRLRVDLDDGVTHTVDITLK